MRALVEKFLFIAILLLIPTNLFKVLSSEAAYVNGILVDYLLPRFALVDFLVLSLLFLWGINFLTSGRIRVQRPSSKCSSEVIFFAASAALLCAVSASVVAASNRVAALAALLRLALYILFAVYVSRRRHILGGFRRLVFYLSWGALFEGTLVVFQWLNRGSLLGYWFLGEFPHNSSVLGVATMNFFGRTQVLPYGTFPHPNALGGYLSLILPWIIFILRRDWKQTSSLKKTFFILAGILGFTGLALTFSQSAWVSAALGLFGTLLISRIFRPAQVLFGCGIYLDGAVAKLSDWLSRFSTSLSVVRRLELNRIALAMFQDHSLFGVGLNNFTVHLPGYGRVSGPAAFLQPAHNVFLLILAETGALGLLGFLGILSAAALSLFRRIKHGVDVPVSWLLLVSLSQIVILAMTDHYFWTLAQTALIFWLTVGLTFSYNHPNAQKE